MSKAQRILTDILVLAVCMVLALGLYKLGVHRGEQTAIESMHVMDIEKEENGDYAIVILLKGDEYLHVWSPYWRAPIE